ncbi:MAG: alpha-glucan phosphorylase [Thermotogae bacterium]|nr:alpha-glucan family phosphorylase [Kosmotoga sp.]MBO8166097.1 alpha-glucan family phosphorylase [Kosmotoga sp.]RKX49732.1 MAG: alpha-glucan phosphorylase [Thermotogota bacterium]
MYFIEKMRAIPRLPDRIKKLEELAYNFWWTWNPEAEELFKDMDQELWYEVKRSPVKLLRRVDQDRLQELSKSKDFLENYDKVLQQFEQYMEAEDTWIKRTHPDKANDQIAYFCAEYGLHESFPIYSGGLGILAGDHLKTASDLGINLVGVGLLYRHGYFNQTIDETGWQHADFPAYDFEDFPVRPAFDEDNEEIYVKVDFPERRIWVKIWQAQVGRTPLILLDTDIPQNDPEDRKITSQLYGGNRETRIQQEIVLGIAGVRALRLLGYNPRVWHMNEGHAAFLSLERIREFVQSKGLDFRSAVEATKAGSVFTTHTPVPAGNDVFDVTLIDKYFNDFWPRLNISRREFLDLGIEKSKDGREHFSMTVLALRLSAVSNGVSKLHGKVSRHMWTHIFPDFPEPEVPIGHVTNGVHIWTWLNRDLKELFDRYLPENWHENVTSPEVWEHIDDIPDEELWRVHLKLKKRMRTFLHGRLRRQRLRLGETIEDLMEVDDILPENILTIGFARRFATYKRATLIFKDIERLKKILMDSERPVQFIFAGKAHPADDPGKNLIKKIYEVSRMPEFKNRIVILENYDMNVARHMVSGVDVWLNNPRRPHEASGTSGQKAGMNGAINFSALDGWWVEGYNGENGWTIGDNRDYEDTELQDRIDSVSIYSTLEKEIVPLYYKTDEKGIPTGWIKKMKASIKSVALNFNTHRMLMDYANKIYLKAMGSMSFVERDSYNGALSLSKWEQRLRQNWDFIRIKPNIPRPGFRSSISVGQSIEITANVYLGELTPEEVKVEIFVAKFDENDKMIAFKTFPMEIEKEDVHGEYLYHGKFNVEEEGKMAYTVRVVPNSELMPLKSFIPLAKWV